MGSNATGNVEARRQRVLRYYLRGLTADEYALRFELFLCAGKLFTYVWT